MNLKTRKEVKTISDRVIEEMSIEELNAAIAGLDIVGELMARGEYYNDPGLHPQAWLMQESLRYKVDLQDAKCIKTLK